MSLETLNSGLVAVPSPTIGGFHIYMTGGLFDPSKWIRGTLRGASYIETKAELRALAAQDGRTLRKHRDYFQLRTGA